MKETIEIVRAALKRSPRRSKRHHVAALKISRTYLQMYTKEFKHASLQNTTNPRTNGGSAKKVEILHEIF